MDGNDCNKKSKKVGIWNKENLATFLDIFEGFPCLYDPKHKFYANKHARADALAKIKETMGRPDLSVEDIKTKINNLRTQISHELKRLKENHSGWGSDEMYEPVWWFDLAQFLVPHVKPRKGKDNLETTREMETSTQDCNTEESSTEYASDPVANDDSQLFDVSTPTTSTGSTQRSKKQKTVANSDVSYLKTVETLRVLNDNMVKAIDNASSEVKREADFINFIGKELEAIDDPELLLEAKFEISNIVFKYKKMWLNKHKNTTFEIINDD